MTLEERLKAYADIQVTLEEEKVQKTIEISKEALLKGEAQVPMSDFDFLFQQAGFIRKRWWVVQAMVLIVLWALLYTSGSMAYMQRSVGILASLFAIMLIPELWKSQKNMSLEIEGTSYFSIRKIYASRMLLFTMVDIVILSAFFLASAVALKITMVQLITQFFIPMNVTCCICFRNLCSNKEGSDYSALVMSLIWIAVWVLIILNDKVYEWISAPVWAGIVGFSFIYLVYCIRSVWKKCEKYWEVNPSWN